MSSWPRPWTRSMPTGGWPANWLTHPVRRHGLRHGYREAIAEAGHGHDQLRLSGIGLELAAQAADQHVDRAVDRRVFLARDRIQQLLARQNPERCRGEGGEQVEFGRGERDLDLVGRDQ